jgi:hypothetical protein
VAAFVPALSPAAHADSRSDVYAANFTCDPDANCPADPPSAADGTDFATSFIIDYRGVDFDFSGLTVDPFATQPGDSFGWTGDFIPGTGVETEIFALLDTASGASLTYMNSVAPNGLEDSFDHGTLTFVDQTAVQPAPEPASVALLALGLGSVAFFSRRKASATAY